MHVIALGFFIFQAVITKYLFFGYQLIVSNDIYH
jgi:hypothetical protein